MKKILNHLKTYRVVYSMAIIFFILVGGVSFKKILDRHTRLRKGKIEFIIIHYTANLSPGATAEMNARYLQRKRNAGCHYAIDDDEIVQCVPENRVAYAVGDKKWLGFIPKPWLKGKIFNENSLSYEMCLGGGRNDSLIIDRTARCVAWQIVNKGFFRIETFENRGTTLQKKVPDLGRVVRHHDVSGKHCPKFHYKSEWNQELEDKSFYRMKLLIDKYAREKIQNLPH